MSDRELPSYRQLQERPHPYTGTAWGLFGADDQLGTLNHLTPERVRAAAGSIREGLQFSLNLPLGEFDPPLIAHRGLLDHEVFGLNEYHRDDRVDNLFPQASTQIDALRHFAHPDHGFYNGVSGGDIATGTPELGIQAVAERGIVARGLLVDLERYRRDAGRPIDHAASEQIDIDDIEAAITWQGSEPQPGDALMIRFGWIDYRRGTVAPERLTSAGLAATEKTAAWLWDQQFSLVAADNVALEAWPADPDAMPTRAEAEGRLERSSHTGMLHRTLIPLLGLAIGELWDLEALADACVRRERYDVFLTAAPLHLLGGVGSPANAIAII